MDHGFQDPIEAKKFEKLMSEYNVESVYLSHIHSYLEYKIDDVNYIITGGAGAELLTKNSYYHYMIAKLVDPNRLISVELPSPTNFYLSRYSATLKLFSSAMYEENPISVILIITGFAILLILIVIKIYLWKKRGIDTIGSWLKDMWRYGKKSFKSRHDNNDKQ